MTNDYKAMIAISVFGLIPNRDGKLLNSRGEFVSAFYVHVVFQVYEAKETLQSRLKVR